VPFRASTDPKFRRRLDKKSPKQRAAVLECMRKLLDDPRQDTGLRSKKLRTSGEDVWYSRASRSERVTWAYGAEQNTIVFLNHCDHDEVLRNP